MQELQVLAPKESEYSCKDRLKSVKIAILIESIECGTELQRETMLGLGSAFLRTYDQEVVDARIDTWVKTPGQKKAIQEIVDILERNMYLSRHVLNTHEIQSEDPELRRYIMGDTHRRTIKYME